MRLIIISNRLPVKVSTNEEEMTFTRSEGGLATGLGSLEMASEKHWIGWPGLYTEEEFEQQYITAKLAEENFHPVFLSPDQIEDYYEGYSNSVLWPLCHYFYTYIEYDTKFWDAYRKVNRLFCEEAMKIIQPEDTVWVQDYQLMLLPAYLREKMPGLSIGYFHHIPFPSYELFRVLPDRADLLKGLMGADLIGFHTHDYMRHFISTAYRVLGVDCLLDEINYENRMVHVDTFPMGINFPLHFKAVENEVIKSTAVTLKEQFGHHKIILSVDRLDYSKGILHRLRGFEQFLDRNPEYCESVSMVMVVVPSRDSVEKYADLKTRTDETIGAINGRYSTLNWTPVYYFYRSFPFEELMAMYLIADIALVTPLRDGMNLVAKEYVAVKGNAPGILILSEMAGASVELTDALIVNPNNVDEIENAILEAMKMDEPEQERRLKKMQKKVSVQTIDKWANDFVHELDIIKKRSLTLLNKQLALNKDPEKAVPDIKLSRILEKLNEDARNTIVINSGRDPETLDKWFGHLNILLAAEHGAFYKEKGIWYENSNDPVNIGDEIFEILNFITNKTPGSSIETKKRSVVWHYRNSDAWLANLREKQLIDALMVPCSRENLQVMKGNKVVEIKAAGVNKGIEVLRLIEKDHFDFILAMGDDVTDEDMFHSLPPEAITIKVGSYSDLARFSIESPARTVEFLEFLTLPSHP
jgi:trehalose 6-phosphate synthase/phosphatase